MQLGAYQEVAVARKSDVCASSTQRKRPERHQRYESSPKCLSALRILIKLSHIRSIRLISESFAFELLSKSRNGHVAVHHWSKKSSKLQANSSVRSGGRTVLHKHAQ